MIINPKETTVAYRCPACGAGVMSAVGVFSLSAEMIKLKCTCGQSEMKIVYNKDDQIRLSVPCMFCPSPHNFLLNKSVFFGKELFSLQCPYSDINICCIGETNQVKAELARTELIRMGLLAEDAEILDFHRERVPKAYPAYFDTYSQIDTLVDWLNVNVSNLYCIGRNGQHRYNNMDHSMVTAFETVKHILNGGNGTKSAIWNVNTEKEYHEESRK